MKYLLVIPISIVTIALIPVGILLGLLGLVGYSFTSFLSWFFGDVHSRPLRRLHARVNM